MSAAESDTIVVYTRPCPMCGVPSQLEMTKEQLDRYNSGALPQDVFPTWNSSKRELVITGTHSECWDAMFPNKDE
jgi:hypothetical protein